MKTETDQPPLVTDQHSNRYQALIDFLTKNREVARLTQRQLSDKLQRHRNYINRVESGERTLDFVEAIDVALALGIDPFDMMDHILSLDKPEPQIDPIMVTAAVRKTRAKSKPKPKKKR